MTAGREKVIFLGPLPPPFMGPTLATDIILSSKLADAFDLVHIDTSDHRDLRRLAAIDATNILLAFLHYFRLLKRLLAGGARLVYIPVSQTTIGFLRDAVFIILARLFRRPVICHLRGGRFDLWTAGASPLTRFIVRRVLASIQGMIVLGESIARQFDGWVPPERLHVVPNGADYPTPAKPRERDGTLHILYLGNLQAGKGIVDVVEAAAVLKRKGVAFRLDAVGAWRDDRVRDECLRICAAGDLPVKFHPPATGGDKFDYLAAADLFVFTPRQREGHPWVIVEAMAAGLPVIATDQGAIAETVIDGESGWIVPAGDGGAIAGKAALLAGDAKLRERMGQAARTRYEEHYTEAVMVRGLAAAFRAAMAGRRQTNP